LDSTILENIPMESNHQLNWNITLSDGYNRHFPRALVFAPRHHGGLEYVHLYLSQGQRCLRLLLRHILHNAEIGKQIRIDIAWIQLEAGASAAIFEDIQTDLDYLQDGWVPGIRRFLKTVDGEITFTGPQGRLAPYGLFP
jgi:hypothetical protein